MTTFTFHRPRHNVIEWTITNELNEQHTYHANRSAAFFDGYDGRYARQMGGAAWTPWHEDDKQVERLISRRFRARCLKRPA